MNQEHVKRGRAAPAELADAARKLIDTLGGDVEAARSIGIGRATLSRLLAGQPLSEGTIAILERRFPDVKS